MKQTDQTGKLPWNESTKERECFHDGDCAMNVLRTESKARSHRIEYPLDFLAELSGGIEKNIYSYFFCHQKSQPTTCDATGENDLVYLKFRTAQIGYFQQVSKSQFLRVIRRIQCMILIIHIY